MIRGRTLGRNDGRLFVPHVSSCPSMTSPDRERGACFARSIAFSSHDV
jgi:hypothetical protein